MPNKHEEKKEIEIIDKQKKASSWKLSLKQRENDILKEKLNIQAEKEKVKIKLAKLKKELELSRVKQKEISLKVKGEIATLKADASVQRAADKEMEKKKKSNIKLKKNNITTLKAEMDQKLKIQLSKDVIKAQELKKSIKEAKQKIIDEKRKTANDLRIRKENEREKARKLNLELKAEHAKLKQELMKERLEHKREIINKKLELAIEMDQHKKGIQSRLLKQKSEKQKEIAEAKRETAELLQEQSRLKMEASKMKIKSRLRIQEIGHEVDLEIQREKENHEAIKMESEIKVNQIKERAKQVEKFDEDVEYKKDNDARVGLKDINHDKPIEAEPSIELTQEIPDDMTTREFKIVKSKEDIVTFVSTWRNFDKKGEKLLKVINDDITSKEIKKYSRSEYFKTSIENYESLVTKNLLVSFEDIIRNSYILAEETIDDEVIATVYSTMCKAILNKLRVKIGSYYIVPTKVEGKRTFVVMQDMIHGEQVFDLSPLMSQGVVEGVSEIIDYKLIQGNAIKVFDGLAIESYDGDLQIAVNANVLRIG